MAVVPMASIDVTCVAASVNWMAYVSTTTTAAISVHRPAATAPGYMAASTAAAYMAASASASASAANQRYEIATRGFKSAENLCLG